MVATKMRIGGSDHPEEALIPHEGHQNDIGGVKESSPSVNMKIDF